MARHTGALLVLLSACAVVANAQQRFGEQWIAQFGYTTTTFRFYLAQPAKKFWPADAYDLSACAQRTSFQGDMQDRLSSYLEILPSRISFPVPQYQPTRSWLFTPNGARDPRSYIDVTIQYPSASPYNAWPKDITASAAWMLGGDGDSWFPARWSIGLQQCDSLDPMYAYTNPFCSGKQPLCNRVVQTF